MTDLFDSKTDAARDGEPVKKAPGTRQKSAHGHCSEMENASISHIVRERLTALGLAQIPPGALAILIRKLEGQVRNFAAKTITPRAAARAVLASAQVKAVPTGSINGGTATEPTPNP